MLDESLLGAQERSAVKASPSFDMPPPSGARLHWLTLRFESDGGIAMTKNRAARLEASFQHFAKQCLRARGSGPVASLHRWLQRGFLYGTLLALVLLEEENTVLGKAIVAARFGVWIAWQLGRAWVRHTLTRCSGIDGGAQDLDKGSPGDSGRCTCLLRVAEWLHKVGRVPLLFFVDLAFFLLLFSSGYVLVPGMARHFNLPVRACVGLSLFAGYSTRGVVLTFWISGIFLIGDLAFACHQLRCGICTGGGAPPPAEVDWDRTAEFASYATVLIACGAVLISRAHVAEAVLRQSFYQAKVQANDISDLELRMDPFRLSNLRGFIGVGGGEGLARTLSQQAEQAEQTGQGLHRSGSALNVATEKLKEDGGVGRRMHALVARSPVAVEDEAVDSVVMHGSGTAKHRSLQRSATAPQQRRSSSTLARFGPNNPLSAWEILAADLFLGRKIAAGGSGQVFEGTHLGRAVAVKQIFGQAMVPESLEELATEMQFMHRLLHPSIVQLFGFALATDGTGSVLIVEELCTGGALVDVLVAEQGRRAKGAECVAETGQRESYRKMCEGVAKQVCSALIHVHKEGIAHRDIKLENILLDAQGCAKLCDFGISRQYVSPGTQRHRVSGPSSPSRQSSREQSLAIGTDTGSGMGVFGSGDRGSSTMSSFTGMGTPQYMAPELLRGEGGWELVEAPHQSGSECAALCEAADVYAFGVVLWALRLCRLPWGECKTPFEVIRRVGMEGQSLSLDELDEGAQLTDVLRRCLSPVPAHRPTFAQLLADLQQVPLEEWGRDGDDILVSITDDT